MKDLGYLKYFLRIKVMRLKGGIFISLRKYILNLLEKSGMVDCKPAETPVMVNNVLRIEENEKSTDQRPYHQKLKGKLIYLSHTCPNIAYSVGIVSQIIYTQDIQNPNTMYSAIRSPSHDKYLENRQWIMFSHSSRSYIVMGDGLAFFTISKIFILIVYKSFPSPPFPL